MNICQIYDVVCEVDYSLTRKFVWFQLVGAINNRNKAIADIKKVVNEFFLIQLPTHYCSNCFTETSFDSRSHTSDECENCTYCLLNHNVRDCMDRPYDIKAKVVPNLEQTTRSSTSKLEFIQNTGFSRKSSALYNAGVDTRPPHMLPNYFFNTRLFDNLRQRRINIKDFKLYLGLDFENTCGLDNNYTDDGKVINPPAIVWINAYYSSTVGVQTLYKTFINNTDKSIRVGIKFHGIITTSIECGKDWNIVRQELIGILREADMVFIHRSDHEFKRINSTFDLIKSVDFKSNRIKLIDLADCHTATRNGNPITVKLRDMALAYCNYKMNEFSLIPRPVSGHSCEIGSRLALDIGMTIYHKHHPCLSVEMIFQHVRSYLRSDDGRKVLANLPKYETHEMKEQYLTDF